MRTKLKFILLLAASVLCSGILWIPHSYAATGQIYVSPSSSSVVKGNTITIALRVNPGGTAINTFEGNITYDPSALQYDNMNLNSSFRCFTNSGGGGSVAFSGCAIFGGGTISGDTDVADITFTALAGSGSSGLSLSGGNAAGTSGWLNPTNSSGSVSFSTPAAPAPTPVVTNKKSSPTVSHSSAVSKPAAATTPTATTPAAATPTTSPATVSVTPVAKVKVNITSVKAQFSDASITFKTTSPVQTYIKYGTSRNNLNLSTPVSSLGVSNSISLGSLPLTPGTTYYYQGIAEVNGSVVGQTAVKPITTKGYSISVAVLDNHYRPLVGKVVYLHSAVLEATTNSQGIATFFGASPGFHHIEYKSGTNTYSQSIYIADNMTNVKGVQTSKQQSMAVVLTSLEQPASFSYNSVALTITLVAFLIVAWLALRKTALHSRINAFFQRILFNFKRDKYVKI
jgi:hypothetical protein